LRLAVVLVALTTVLGYLSALPLPRLLGIGPLWGVAGLTASAGFARWVEFLLLRRGMNRKIGKTDFPAAFFARLWLAAVIAAGAAWAIKLVLHPQQPQVAAVLILVPYAALYLGGTMLLGGGQAGALVKRGTRTSNE